jgi:hypothetical protein
MGQHGGGLIVRTRRAVGGWGVEVDLWIAPGKNNSAAMYLFRLHDRGNRWHGAIYLLYGPKYSTVPGAPIRNGWTLAHTSTTVYQSDELQEKPEIASKDELSAVYAAHIP